jgi:hypothetical protein
VIVRLLLHKFLLAQKVFFKFLRNDHDCKIVDPYNARKRYAVIKSSDLMRNIRAPHGARAYP